MTEMGEGKGEAQPSSSIFGHRAFTLFWCSRVMSSLAFQMQGVAIGWQMYAITGRALDLGLVGLAQFLPMILLTFLVGSVADRYDRRRIINICQFTGVCAVGALIWGSVGGWLDRNSILAIVAVLGGARAFESPTMSALMPGLVPREIIQRAIAFTNSAGETAQIVGPALGGALFGLGPLAAYATAAAFYAIALAFSLSIPKTGAAPVRRAITLKSIFSGVSFIYSRQAILGAISLDLFAVLLGGAVGLLPIFASDILHVGPVGLGLLRGMPAIGALAMSLFLARFPLLSGVGMKLFGAVIAFGLATILFGLSKWVWLSFLALFMIGASDVISVVIRSSLVQILTPDEMRGRVNAVDSLFTGTSNQLGQFESGVTADWFGTVPSVLIGGIGTILVALLWFRLFPSLRRVQTLEG